MELPIGYGDKVFKFLQNGKVGATYTIDRICAKENKEIFIALVKEYMDMVPWQGGWVFNDDYTKLKRNSLPVKTKQTQNRGFYKNR